MVCDHVPFLNPDALFSVAGNSTLYYGFPLYIMHTIGRITAPIFFYMIAAGYRRTHDANRYALRLFIFACISYIPAIWYFYGAFPNKETFLDFNILFSMFFGLLLLRSIHEIRNIPLKILCALLCLAAFHYTEFGYYGAGMILAFDLCGSSRVKTAIGTGLVTLAYILYSLFSPFVRYGFFYAVHLIGIGTMPEFSAGTDLPSAFAYYISYYTGNPFGRHVLVVMFAHLLPIVLVLLCRDFRPERPRLFTMESEDGPIEIQANSLASVRRSPVRKWFFYVFYPGHITLLLLIRIIFVT
jgi:hypothetical protein